MGGRRAPRIASPTACRLRRGRQVPKKPPRVTLSCALMFGFYRRLLWVATMAIVTAMLVSALFKLAAAILS